MTIKTIIKYEDWLMLTRGKIEPKVGDKIITNSARGGNYKLQTSIVRRIEDNHIIFYKSTNRHIEDIWVEVEIETSDIKL